MAKLRKTGISVVPPQPTISKRFAKVTPGLAIFLQRDKPPTVVTPPLAIYVVYDDWSLLPISNDIALIKSTFGVLSNYAQLILSEFGIIILDGFSRMTDTDDAGDLTEVVGLTPSTLFGYDGE